MLTDSYMIKTTSGSNLVVFCRANPRFKARLALFHAPKAQKGAEENKNYTQLATLTVQEAKTLLECLKKVIAYAKKTGG